MSSNKGDNSCRVCTKNNLIPLFESSGDFSFTSAQTSIPLKIRVSFCRSCGHAQTPPLENIAEYYDTAYNFRNGDPEEDDIYIATNDQIVFRTEHQAAIIEAKLDLSSPVRILDYGCAKASSLRKLIERHPNVIPYAFDVSESYVPSWDQFIPRHSQATYRIPDTWNGLLDVVLSFFSLEHVDDPRGFVRVLRKLLRPNGRVHLIVPNLYQNVSDLLVADHINHFSTISLRRLFEDAGFCNIHIDTDSHRAALLVSAMLDPHANAHASTKPKEVEDVEADARTIAAEWSSSAAKIRAYEHSGKGRKIAIYGSGVYGLFIAATLTSLDNIACFVDMNPFRQGLTLLNRPVIAPQDLEEDVETVFVGLNPQYARQIIEQTTSLHSVERNFVFL
jgi:SAM-dependent methyltransferase